MAKRRNPITGQWSARLIDMQRSCAWRVLSRAAHQCLSRIEIELADHGGNDIDQLPVTFNDFEEYGVNRHAIAPALAELEALGFVDITERGRTARAAEYRRSNKFRLLTRPWEKKGATRPGWDRFKTLAEAETTAAEARRNAAKEKSASAESAPRPVRKAHHGGKKASAETAPLANVGNRTTIYISDVDASGVEDADPSQATVPGRFHCRRAGALSFQRWGQVTPETPAPAKRSRSAGGLSQARWRTAADSASGSQPPIVIEARPPNEALPSNAHHGDPRRLTVDVLSPHAPTAALVH
jgi:hypothetical protein